jgi:hypothetical protein
MDALGHQRNLLKIKREKKGELLLPLSILFLTDIAHAANKCIAKMQADGSCLSVVVILFGCISGLTLSI